MIMQYKGSPPINVLEKASRRKLFFDSDLQPLPFKDKRGNSRKNNSRAIANLLKGVDKSFIRFIDACFHWDPDLRMGPEEALCHEWIIKGLPQQLL